MPLAGKSESLAWTSWWVCGGVSRISLNKTEAEEQRRVTQVGLLPRVYVC